MKKNTFLPALLVALACSWYGCTPASENGTLQLGLDFTEGTDLKAAVADTELSAALITIIGKDGNVIYEKEPLTLYRFGSSYTTSSLRIPVGSYRLTEFMLIDAAGEVIWATPLEGSPLAHLVRGPLPRQFDIGHEQTTSLDIQVIRVMDRLPSDFGYINFDIGFVERFCLKVHYEYSCPEWGVDDRIDSTGVAWPIMQSRLTLHAGGRMVLNEALDPGRNHFMVPMPFEVYLLTATDCRGMVLYEKRFSMADLLEHRCGDNYRPLVIGQAPDGIIITPEGLHEPTIAQGVFGSINIPVIDSTYTENYDVRPVVRDIFFFPYAVLDSLAFFAPIDCYTLHPGMFNTEPVAIVRSNSEGYFQVPLRPGTYLYMVRERDRFYIDAWISSHRPGQVTVYPAEVTKLMIHIIDCSMWY
jgi:hypothetical protein